MGYEVVTVCAHGTDEHFMRYCSASQCKDFACGKYEKRPNPKQNPKKCADEGVERMLEPGVLDRNSVDVLTSSHMLEHMTNPYVWAEEASETHPQARRHRVHGIAL